MTTTTAFEQRVALGGAVNWSFMTLAEELTFLQDLAASSDRFRYWVAGTSYDGHTMYACAVSYPNATAETLANRRIVFVTGSLHGSEPSGREGAFQYMRDLVESNDASIISYLSEVAWVFVPTANPDGLTTWEVGIRQNGAGVDLNRDQISCSQPESQAIQSVVSQYMPDITLDLHEQVPQPEVTSIWMYDVSTNAMHDARIVSEANTIVNSYAKPAIISAGYTVSRYPYFTNDDLQLTVVAMPFRGACHVTSECLRTGGTAPETNSVRTRNVRIQKLFMESVRTYHSTRVSALAAICDDVRNDYAVRGLTRSAAYDWDNGQTTNPAPAGYQLSAGQFASVANFVASWGIGSYASGSNTIIPLGQKAACAIPHILDAKSSTELVAATAITTLPMPPARTGGAPATYSVRVGEQTVVPTFRNSSDAWG